MKTKPNVLNIYSRLLAPWTLMTVSPSEQVSLLSLSSQTMGVNEVHELVPRVGDGRELAVSLTVPHAL